MQIGSQYYKPGRRYRLALAQHREAAEAVHYTRADRRWVAGYKRGRGISNNVAYEEYAAMRAIIDGLAWLGADR